MNQEVWSEPDAQERKKEVGLEQKLQISYLANNQLQLELDSFKAQLEAAKHQAL